MPYAAKKICLKPGCGKLSDASFCPAHLADAPARQWDRERGSAHARGYGRRHARLRLMILARDPLCKIGLLWRKYPSARPLEECKGLRPSTIMDHIIPKRQGGDDSEANLQGCCQPCHDWKRATLDKMRRSA